MSSKSDKIIVVKAEVQPTIVTVKALTRKIIKQNPLVFERLAKI